MIIFPILQHFYYPHFWAEGLVDHEISFITLSEDSCCLFKSNFSDFHFTFSVSINLGGIVISCGLEGVFSMWQHPCVDCVNPVVLAHGHFKVPATSFGVWWLVFPCLGCCWHSGCPEPVLDAGQGSLFAVWLSLPCRGCDLLPSCWIEALRVRFYQALLPLSACPAPEEVIGYARSPMWTCTSRVQLSLALAQRPPSSCAFRCVHPTPVLGCGGDRAVRIWLGLEPRHCGCRETSRWLCFPFDLELQSLADLFQDLSAPDPAPGGVRSGWSQSVCPFELEFSQVQVSLPWLVCNQHALPQE